MTTTYPDHASTPELRAQYDAMSPNARSFVDSLDTFLGSLAPDNRKLAEFGFDALLTACERQHNPQPEPRVDHEEEGGEEKDEWYSEISIGVIDGCEVIGSYHNEDGKLFSAKMTWNGLTLHTDGTDYLNFNLGNAGDGYDELGCVGDMHLWEWGKIKELAQTDVVEQLIMLTRKKAQRTA